MKARLFCKTGILSDKEYEILDEATIGKKADNSIVLETRIVSGKHARIFFDQNEKAYFLEDLRSRNGTRLDGVRVTQKEKLDKLHVITFAENFDFIFQVVDESTPMTQPRTARPTRQPETTQKPPQTVPKRPPVVPPSAVKEAGATAPSKGVSQSSGRTIFGNQPAAPPKLAEQESQSKTLLDIESRKTTPGGEPVGKPPISGAAQKTERELFGKSEGKTVLDKVPLRFPDLASAKTQGRDLGKSPEEAVVSTTAQPIFSLDVMILGKEKKTFPLKKGENLVGRSQESDVCIDDPSMSRRHAIITVKGSKVMIRDLGSKNRTQVNRKAIDAEVEIRAGGKILFGTVEAQLVRN